MTTSSVVYQGNLRTLATHIKSGSTLETDAPVDNNGKGMKFSPTDLTATSLACCMFTLIGIHAEKNDIPLGSIHSEVTKTMASNPRRISRIAISIQFGGKEYSDREKKILEHAARTCPVALSLHPEIEQAVEFRYSG